MKEIDEDLNGTIVASEFNDFFVNRWDKNWKEYLREIRLLGQSGT